MMSATQTPVIYGIDAPRLAPPLPLHHKADELVKMAKRVGITLFPWQGDYAAKYLMARNGERWLHREVCIVVARQNGKTKLLVPRILWALEQGRRVVHTAQRRDIARAAFVELADAIPSEMLARPIRWANGQERILTKAGGSYMIVAPQRGVRGLSADDLIIDELREFVDYDFMMAAGPILTASADPQTIYLSNAGTDESIVLNDLRDGQSGRVAYVEWSADETLARDDERGWAQANPAMGHLPLVYEELQHAYATKPPEFFETEHLCRRARSLVPPLVTDAAWDACEAEALDKPPSRAHLGVALDSAGRRASAVLAWAQADGTYGCEVVLDETDESAVDTDEVGAELRNLARRRRVRYAGYSGATDVALARHLPKSKAIDGALYANASANFATLVEGRLLRWVNADAIGEDLHNIVRKQTSGAWSAVNSDPRKPATAALAAIRAVWLASAPRSVPRVG